MAIHENFETTKPADALQESKPSTQAILPMERAYLGQLKRDNQQQTDGLVGKGVLPSVDLFVTPGDTRAGRSAAPTRVAEAGAEETYGQKTDASNRTVEAVGKGIENSKLSADDKKVAQFIVRTIAEGDTGKLQDLVDALDNAKGGRQRLTKIVEQLNDMYGKSGIRDLKLEYPLKDEDGTHWELQVSGKSKSGQRYVTFKPGERPISSMNYGQHDDLDRADSAQANKAQEKDSAKVLRNITEHGQKRLEENEQKAKDALREQHARELEQLRRELESR